MSNKTQVVIAKKLFCIYKIEDIELAKELGKNIEDVPSFKPVFRCGMTKAKAIADHIDELKDYVGEE